MKKTNLKARICDWDGKWYLRNVYKTFQDDYCVKMHSGYITLDKLKWYGWTVELSQW